jgi:Ca-activated chloride channel family protein
VVVAIDTSRSMLATDVAPNRLKRAQLAALDLKRLARGDRFGLVAFAGSAFLQCPLTIDNEVYRQSVEALDVKIIPQGGTALAEAIQAARGAFKEGDDNHKVLVLFTDGEDHDGNALEAAKAAGKEGLRIFTIGVGTPEGELLRTTDTQGRMEFLKDAEGQAIKSRLNEDLLRKLAQETGGFYLRMAGANSMNLLYERGLAPLPRGELSSQRIKRYHERYQWLLGAAIALLLIEMFLPERKPAKPMKPTSTASPSPVAPPAAKAAAVLLLLLAPSVVHASAGRALKEYEKGKFERAFDEYESALKKKPDDARLHYNAGAAAFQHKDFAQALEHLNSALVTQDLGLQQRAYYNVGNAQFRLGEDTAEPDKRMRLWEQALKNYDSALKLDGNDADARFNQDFVKRKLEELKQQQQDQKQKNGNNEDKNQDKKDQSKQPQNKDQPSKDEQKKQPDQQQKQQQDPQDSPGQKPEDQQSQQQKKQSDQPQQAGKPDQKPGDKDKEQQSSKPGEKQDESAENSGEPQGMAPLRMTPEQAIRLLEAFKAEEKNMPFRPILKTNRQDRAFKDW